MFEIFRNILLAGLGAQEKIKESINELVKRGELSESQGARIIKEWAQLADRSATQLKDDIAEVVAKTLEKMNIPTKEDLGNLQKKVENLSARLDILEKTLKDTSQNQ
ncbi:MAG: phasin family protein [Thermodesulfovibrionales bacterium]|nr:phasin family protein [Thermodesulfovibrionales bacterium]